MRRQIIICFSDGKWMCDFITVNEYQTQQEAIDEYVNKYEQVQGSMEIVSSLLPSIIHISFMEE